MLLWLDDPYPHWAGVHTVEVCTVHGSELKSSRGIFSACKWRKARLWTVCQHLKLPDCSDAWMSRSQTRQMDTTDHLTPCACTRDKIQRVYMCTAFICRNHQLRRFVVLWPKFLSLVTWQRIKSLHLFKLRELSRYTIKSRLWLLCSQYITCSLWGGGDYHIMACTCMWNIHTIGDDFLICSIYMYWGCIYNSLVSIFHVWSATLSYILVASSISLSTVWNFLVCQ